MPQKVQHSELRAAEQNLCTFTWMQTASWSYYSFRHIPASAAFTPLKWLEAVCYQAAGCKIGLQPLLCKISYVNDRGKYNFSLVPWYIYHPMGQPHLRWCIHILTRVIFVWSITPFTIMYTFLMSVVSAALSPRISTSYTSTFFRVAGQLLCNGVSFHCGCTFCWGLSENGCPPFRSSW